MSKYSDIYNFYCDYTVEHTKYVILSYDQFSALLDRSITLEEENGLLIGNIYGNNAYITLLYGEMETKTKLVKSFEKVVRNTNVSKIYIHFFNPDILPWYPIEKIEHPGYQGVILDSDDHKLFNKLGYIDNSIQDTYYMSLDLFHEKQEYEDLLTMNRSNKMTIELYDRKRHKGLLTFTEELHHPTWRDAILKRGDMPLIVALFNNKIVGFTGPLKTEASGRGYFAGIGVLEGYRGYGLGKLLFYTLCKEHKKLGSKYMTLFTGRNNYAKKIYLDNGFSVVESFMTLIKEL